MNKEEFKNKVELLINDINNLIEKMPKKGLKEYECQRVCLENSLNKFE